MKTALNRSSTTTFDLVFLGRRKRGSELILANLGSGMVTAGLTVRNVTALAMSLTETVTQRPSIPSLFSSPLRHAAVPSFPFLFPSRSSQLHSFFSQAAARPFQHHRTLLDSQRPQSFLPPSPCFLLVQLPWPRWPSVLSARLPHYRSTPLSRCAATRTHHADS